MRISDWSSDVCSSDLDAISVEVPVLWCREWRPVDLDRLSVLCAFSYCPDRFDPHAGDMLVPVFKGEPISLHKGCFDSDPVAGLHAGDMVSIPVAVAVLPDTF